MKRLLLLLLPITLLFLGGCSDIQNNCQKYAEWYCNAAIWVAHYPKVLDKGKNKKWFTDFVCTFSCAEIILVEETQNF